MHMSVNVKAVAWLETYTSVGSLLLFVTLLVGGGLGLEGSLLLLVEALPSLTEELADVACDVVRRRAMRLNEFK